MNERTRWIGLVLFVLVCLGVGGLGAVATTPEIDGWYRTVVKPEWNPPDWAFGPDNVSSHLTCRSCRRTLIL